MCCAITLLGIFIFFTLAAIVAVLGHVIGVLIVLTAIAAIPVVATMKIHVNSSKER